MRLGITLAVGLMLLGLPGTASAAPPLGPDGETAPVYDYTSAVRERVFIPQPGIDQDGNGVDDWITIDIIRPSGSSAGEQDPGDHRPEPVLHDALPRQRAAVHGATWTPTASTTAGRCSSTTTSCRAATR